MLENPMDTPLIVELIPDPEMGGFTARIPDIPAYGEGETEDEAISDLKEALRLYRGIRHVTVHSRSEPCGGFSAISI